MLEVAGGGSLWDLSKNILKQGVGKGKSCSQGERVLQVSQTLPPENVNHTSDPLLPVAFLVFLRYGRGGWAFLPPPQNTQSGYFIDAKFGTVNYGHTTTKGTKFLQVNNYYIITDMTS